MATFAIDWAVKKEFQIYNINTKKLRSISPTREAFDKFFGSLSGQHSFYIEEGGGDTFKLLALKYNHQVFTILGKHTKQYRKEFGWNKTDKTDVKIIGILTKTHLEKFRKFEELDIVTAEICILYRELLRHEKKMVRNKNQLFALKQVLELVDLKVSKRVISRVEDGVKGDEKMFYLLKTILTKLVEKHSWGEKLGNIQGVGIHILAGIITNIRRISYFPNKRALRAYAGVTAYGNMAFNHDLKRILYFFAEGVVKKNAGATWRKFYDNRKEYYRGKHPEWSKGRVDGCAKRSIKIKFLDDVYELLR